MADAPKQNLQTTATIAKLFELDERRVQQLAKAGVLPAASTRPYKFDLLPTIKAYIKHLREKANGKEAKTADTGRLAMDVSQAASAAEASALIRSECHKILNELAGYQYDPEAYKRRVRDREGWSEALADEDDD